MTVRQTEEFKLGCWHFGQHLAVNDSLHTTADEGERPRRPQMTVAVNVPLI